MPTDHDNDADLRDTMPPNPLTEPPPAFGEAGEPQANQNSYADFVLSQLLANSRRLASDSAAFHKDRSSLAAMLDEQTKDIKAHVAANYGLVKSEVVALRTEHETFRAEIQALKQRIADLETKLQELS